MVILLDKHKKPLGFTTERRTRKFFEQGRAVMYRRKKYDAGTFKQEGGKIPPSVCSIIGNTETWVKRLCRWINITAASFEAVRFAPS